MSTKDEFCIIYEVAVCGVMSHKPPCPGFNSIATYATKKSNSKLLKKNETVEKKNRHNDKLFRNNNVVDSFEFECCNDVYGEALNPYSDAWDVNVPTDEVLKKKSKVVPVWKRQSDDYKKMLGTETFSDRFVYSRAMNLHYSDVTKNGGKNSLGSISDEYCIFRNSEGVVGQNQ